jgi:hypothetical protein
MYSKYRLQINIGLKKYLSTIRPYLYSSLPENTIKYERFTVDTLYVHFVRDTEPNIRVKFVQLKWIFGENLHSYGMSLASNT